MPPLSATEAALQAAVAACRLLDEGDDDAWDSWRMDSLYPLAKRSEEVLLAVLGLCLWTSPDVRERQVAAMVLGDLPGASRTMLSRAGDLLRANKDDADDPWTPAVAGDIVGHAAAWEG